MNKHLVVIIAYLVIYFAFKCCELVVNAPFLNIPSLILAASFFTYVVVNFKRIWKSLE